MPLQCRTCAEPIFNANPRNLFNHENEDIRQNIEALTGIKLSFDSRLPSHICSCCYLDLDHSMAFRLRCLDANTNLLSHNHLDSEDLHPLDPLIKNEIIQVPNNARSFEGKTNTKISRHISKSNHLNPRVRIRRFQNPIKNGTKACRSTTEQDDSKPMYDIAVAISENIKKAKKRKPRVTSTEKKYICHVCGWAFSDLSNMKDHALRHSGIKKFQCQECSSKFFTRSQLSLHVRVHHKGEMPFVCKYCGMGFRNSPSRCRHELSEAPVPQQLPSTDGDVDAKVKLTEPTESVDKTKNKTTNKKDDKLDKFICELCGLQSNSIANHELHMRRHRGEKNFKCEECGSKHYSKYLMRLHIRVKHEGEKPFACKFCDERFHSGSTRIRHERVRHIRDWAFECKICGKKYLTKSCLNKHKFLHTGLRPYRCDLCNVAFPRRPGLRIHCRTKQHQKRASEAHINPNDVLNAAPTVVSNDETNVANEAIPFPDSLLAELDV
ncbi:hypothetical protein KR215_010789 [Drosophila sulfurigaster]|nr:hypothetical protein KR215_010789 [Drosophila sulfurigaster]